MRATLAAGHVDAVQNSYSLLVRDDDRELLGLCAAEAVSYTVYSPLAGGWLTGKYRRGAGFPQGSRMTQRPDGYAAFLSDAVFDSLEALEQLGEERGISMAGLALAWLLASPLITAIAVGPMRPEHLEPVREARANPLSPAEREAVGGLFS
jgi:aryl-alcohol dehydrogenase-like predicted oxidoreductase